MEACRGFLIRIAKISFMILTGQQRSSLACARPGTLKAEQSRPAFLLSSIWGRDARMLAKLWMTVTIWHRRRP
jgi:hypothetical protein